MRKTTNLKTSLNHFHSAPCWQHEVILVLSAKIIDCSYMATKTQTVYTFMTAADMFETGW